MDHLTLLRAFELGFCVGAGWTVAAALVGFALGVLESHQKRD